MMSSEEDSDSYMEITMEEDKLLGKCNLENNEYLFINKSEPIMDEHTVNILSFFLLLFIIDTVM